MNRSIQDVIEEMEELLDTATAVPLSGGKKMIDVDEFRGLVDDIRYNLPREITQAREIADDRVN
ncbi:MAG: ATPase, partial [Oscillospiraceae bacterium]|nr:ATPase [Oscillospiraceae bacterium]